MTDAECEVNFANSNGCTALHYACLNGHEKVAKTLMEAKADPSAKYIPYNYTLAHSQISVIWRC